MAPKTENPPLAALEDANSLKPQEETNVIEKPKLKLEAIDTSKINPFDPGRLASSVNISANLFTKEQIEIPVVKADKHRFFRVHPDPQFSTQISLLLYDGEFFCVDPSVAAALSEEANPYVLYLCQDRGGNFFFWPIRLPKADETYRWWTSAHSIAAKAREKWVRCVSSKANQCYEMIAAGDGVIPEPNWDTGHTLAYYLELAFGNRLVTTTDHLVVRKLRGLV